MEGQLRVRTERLRWQCRRALLELDIVFERFWERSGGEFDAATLDGMERLLALEDHDLWALVSGRRVTDDAQIQQMVNRINVSVTKEF